LGSLPGKSSGDTLIDPPLTFSTSSPGASMRINPTYKDVPLIQEKLKILKQYIKADRATIAMWKRLDPNYPLLYKVKDQLEANLKIWADIVKDSPCL